MARHARTGAWRWGIIGLASTLAVACGGVSSRGSGIDTAYARAMLDAGKPSAQHAMLENFVGTWNIRRTFWSRPDAVAQEGDGGYEVCEMIYGGRFLRRIWHGRVAGKAIRLEKTWGYNNVNKRFEAAIISDRTTWIARDVGKTSAGGQILTMVGEYPDPRTGGTRKGIEVTKWESRDRFTVDIFDVAKDGSRRRAMELVYTRRD